MAIAYSSANLRLAVQYGRNNAIEHEPISRNVGCQLSYWL